jgi:hypothetical protein
MLKHFKKLLLSPGRNVLGGSYDDKANVMIKTPDNGLLIAGSSLSNDGDVSGHHGNEYNPDAWVVKVIRCW